MDAEPFALSALLLVKRIIPIGVSGHGSAPRNAAATVSAVVRTPPQ